MIEGKKCEYSRNHGFARDLEHVSDKGGTGILLNVPPEPVISGDVFLDITDPRGGRICKGLRSGTERGTITELDIPNGVIKILDNAFKGCGSLRTVTIPDTVTDIDYGSFKGCVSLESVTIPGSVKVIGDYAFESCRSLKEITFSGPVEIGHHAFKGCDLDEKTERRLKELAGSDERYRDIVGKRSG